MAPYSHEYTKTLVPIVSYASSIPQDDIVDGSGLCINHELGCYRMSQY